MKIPALLGIAVILFAIGFGIMGIGILIAKIRARGPNEKNKES